MSRVKICGLTNLDDARHAVRSGADLLGFIFAESPRRITVDQAAEIARALSVEGLDVPTRVGVFVNAEVGEVVDTCVDCGFSTAQLSGEESPDYCRAVSRAGINVIKVFRVRDRGSLEDLIAYDAVDYVLCDAYDPKRAGGTGRTFDHSLVVDLSKRYQLILAGGLNPDNVADAVTRVRPWAVDVSSGVEASPGKKDPAAVEAFIRNAKGATTA
jgi:phosphoribosylanthranilate isomerase